MAYDYRLHGYWRIGQMFHRRGRMEADVKGYADDTIFLRGQLLHVTFAPVWVEFERQPASHRRLAGTKRPLYAKYAGGNPRCGSGDDSSEDERETFPTVHGQAAAGEGGGGGGEHRGMAVPAGTAAPAVRFMIFFATLDPTASDPRAAVSAASQAPRLPSMRRHLLSSKSPPPVAVSQPDPPAPTASAWDGMQDLSIEDLSILGPERPRAALLADEEAGLLRGAEC